MIKLRTVGMFLAIAFLLFSSASIPRTSHAQGLQPDLIVTDVQLSEGQICYYIKNIGTGSAGQPKQPATFQNALFIDSMEKPVVTSEVTLYLAPGQQAGEVCFNFKWQMTQPQHTIMACADWGQNMISESNEENNCLTEVWTQNLPDLIVEKIECGSNGKLAVTIKNQGTGALPDTWTALADVYFNKQHTGFFDLRNPTSTTSGGISSPGGSSYYLVGWDIADQVTVDVYTDYTNNIAESNEQNNSKAEVLTPCMAVPTPSPSPTVTPTPTPTTTPTPTETPKVGDTTSPTVTINHSPSTVNTASHVTFSAIAQDNNSVNKIIIYIDGKHVKECAPPGFAQGFWSCEYSGGPYPAGSLTYEVEAFDPDGNRGVSTEGIIEVQAITFEIPTPEVEVRLPCTISGRLLGFTYSSETVRVKFCEAERVGGGCLSTPPFTCVPAHTVCREGGEVWYADVTRVWSGEETYGNPGPLSYQTQVPCEGTYIIQPQYKPSGEECEWKGTWEPTRSNVITMEGENKRDYDFRFTPQDLTAPSIQTRTTDVARPATFKGEGGFTLYVEAIDSTDGVEKAEVSGTYRVSYFASDATGPLESRKADDTFTLSQECSLWYRGSSRIPYASCRFDIPYYEGGKSIAFDLRISACDAAGNRVETTYSHTFPDEPGDLALVTVEPIQVIYGAPLVRNKNTAFRAKVNSNFPYPVEASFQLTLPPDKWSLTGGTGRVSLGFPVDWSFPELWGPIRIPANASNYEIMLPVIADWQVELCGTGAGDATKILRGREVGGIYGVDVRLMPVPIADRVSFSVQIDPEDEIRETNEGGNTFNSPNYTTVKTKPWRFLIVPYKDDRGCAPYRPSVEAAVKKYLEYLLATYPIAESKLEYAFATTPYSQRCTDDPTLTCEFVRVMNRGATELRQWTARLAEEEGYDLGIAVGCSGGQANFNIMAVTVGDSGKEELLAHEFNHAVSPVKDIYSLDCYASWLESYCELPDGNRFYCCWQDYDSEKEGRESNGIDPMEGCTTDCGPNDSGDCNSGCCWDRCKAECDDRGGTTWQAPDGRPSIMGIMPAADGFWVNKWVKKEGKQYFMDGPTGDNWISARSVREEGYHYCPSPDMVIDYDGYLNMLTHARFVSTIDPEGLLVSGMINKNGEAKFDSFVHLPETVLDIEPGGEGNYYLVLSDKDNRVLSKTGFHVYYYQSDPDGGPIAEDYFAYRIEWKEGTKRIELQDETGNVLASRQVSGNTPDVKVIYPNGGEVFGQGKKIEVKWKANDEDGDVLTYSLSLSKDNGKSWLPVSIDVETNEYEIDTLSLSPADYLVKVRATDGVNTGIDLSDGVFSIQTTETAEKAKEFPLAYIIVTLITGAMVIAFIVYRSKFFKKKQIENRQN